MDIPLLSLYKLCRYTHQGIHTSDKLITFARPCIGYVLQGSAEILLNGQTYTARAGDLLYIAAETEYYSVWSGTPEVQWYSVDFSFADQLAFSDFRFQILHHYPADHWQVMFDCFERDPLRSLGEFYLLLSELYPQMQRSPYVPRYSKISPAVKYLQQNCTKPIRIATLAALCGYSEAHFYTLFQSLMQVSPMTYRTNLLVQRAIRELLETDDSLEAVATRLGFSSANYFCRVFTKTVKKTPGEIRRSGWVCFLGRSSALSDGSLRGSF